MARTIGIIVAVILLAIVAWTLFTQFFGYAVLILAAVGFVAVIAGIIFWRMKSKSPVAVGSGRSEELQRHRNAHRELRKLERRSGKR